jgi:membrane-associated phospholipid phosphatase
MSSHFRSRVLIACGAAAIVASLVTQEASAGHLPKSKRDATVVLDWNIVAVQALQQAKVDPMNQSRVLAMAQAAVHDGLNAIDARYQAYTPGLPIDPEASAAATIAAASHATLLALLPAQQAFLDGAYAQTLAAIKPGAAKDAGVSLGEAAAAAILARRATDGIDQATMPVYVPTGATGDYAFTPPFNFAAMPGWGRLTPFGIDLAAHRLPGPDAMPSALYAFDFNFVKAIGQKDSPVRSAEQSEIAEFWYEDSPIGWNRIATIVIRQQRLDAWQAARALALVNFAMADGFIAGFEAKYHFRFWRPITAIHGAADDQNRKTEADPVWEPFLVTPPVPDYPSTHTVLGAAAAEVLIEVFGDKVRYSMTSTSLPGVTRHYRGFSGAAIENGASRVFAGIHFIRAVVDGYDQGRGIGRAVAKMLPPVD